MADSYQCHHSGQPVRPLILANQPAGPGSGRRARRVWNSAVTSHGLVPRQARQGQAVHRLMTVNRPHAAPAYAGVGAVANCLLGTPEMAGRPPQPVQRFEFHGRPPYGYMNMNIPAGHGRPLPGFQYRPPVPPLPAVGGVNRFGPPAFQGPMQQNPAGVNLYWGPNQPAGVLCLPVSGHFVPSYSYNIAPGRGYVVNGTRNAAPVGFRPVIPVPGQFNSPSPIIQSNPNVGSSLQQMPLSPEFSSSDSTGSAGRSSTPLQRSGSSDSQSASFSNASRTSTSNYGFQKPPSTRDTSAAVNEQDAAVNEQSCDALEGQSSFVSTPGGEQTLKKTKPPIAEPTARGPFLSAVTGQQCMPFPRMPGIPTSGTPPPQPATDHEQQQLHVTATVSKYPGMGPPPPQSSGFISQIGPAELPQAAGDMPGGSSGPFNNHLGYLTGGPSSGLMGGPSSGMLWPPKLRDPPDSTSGLPESLSRPLSSLAGLLSELQTGCPGFSGPPQGPQSGMAGPSSSSANPFHNIGSPTSVSEPPAQFRPLQRPPSPTGLGQMLDSSDSYPQHVTLQNIDRPHAGPPLGPPSRLFSRLPGIPSGPCSGQSQQQGYPFQSAGLGANTVSSIAGSFSRMGINEKEHVVNLLQERELISPEGVETPEPVLHQATKRINCSPDVFRCTLNAIPQSAALLAKSYLPLGILVQPFRDLSKLPLMKTSVIVRCHSCEGYINPFVSFVDQRFWKCNFCFKTNELPDDFFFDPVTKTYGDPQRRPEIRSATIEYISPLDCMVRPPQPAVYLFVLDVSFNAMETGYLQLFSQILIKELDQLPGDAFTQVGFLCFDCALYYFSVSESLQKPKMMVVPDLEEVFLPTPDSLLMNLHGCHDLVIDLVTKLPRLFKGSHETGSCLGFALQAALKLMSTTGGRVTVMQTTLPTVGPGALENREATSTASSLNSSLLGPASDFYKKLALECSAHEVAVDLFMLNGQYADIASISCISKYSAGCVYYYPAFHTARDPAMSEKFECDLRRYLTRKIGFESVLRIRCTRGIKIHTFHGNFFVRSPDLLALPNINPDVGFSMQMSLEDTLPECSSICFQIALLFTSNRGERRVRVHTLCVPTTNQLSEVFSAADQQAIAALLAQMAADRAVCSSLEAAREGLIDTCQNMLSAYASQIPASERMGALLMPYSLRLIPMYCVAILKNIAFKLSSIIRVDDRVFSHLMTKTKPLDCLLQTYYPHLYPVHALNYDEENLGEEIPRPPQIQLNSSNLDRRGVYIMDQGENIYMLVRSYVSDNFCKEVLDVPNFMSIPEGMVCLPVLDNPTSLRLRLFINRLMMSRSGGVSFLVIRDDTRQRRCFFQYLVEDCTEFSMSYYEFLQFLHQKVKELEWDTEQVCDHAMAKTFSRTCQSCWASRDSNKF